MIDDDDDDDDGSPMQYCIVLLLADTKLIIKEYLSFVLFQSLPISSA